LVPVGAETITAVESGLGVFVTVAVRVFARVRVGKGLVVAEGTWGAVPAVVPPPKLSKMALGAPHAKRPT
jgi:hypothetical protein